MNYSEMTDFEINLAVAKLYLPYEHINEEPVIGNSVEWGDGARWDQFDPCNCWDDAGPLIIANKITLLTDETTDEWSSASVQDFCDERAFKFSNCHSNPLRSAMVTYLMMKGAK